MRELTEEQYRRFLMPRTLAVIGVSERTGPLAYNLVENLSDEGCPCRIYPVNVRAREIAGHKAYRSVAEIPEVVDLAVISVPRDAVTGVVRECVDRGIKALVVATQGFADADDEGHRLQVELDRILAGTETRLLGPNTIGVANLLDRFHTSFQKFDLTANASAWLCQSGSFVLGAAEFSGGLGIGIDIGNGADVDFTDLLPWLARDPRIEVINLHIEGIRGGAEFLKAAAGITPLKPMIALKTGRSEAGARAAISHSGSLAGDDHVFAAAFKKAGILRAENVEEVADLNKALLTYKELRGPRIAVVTISGGAGIAAVDALAPHGLEMAALSEESNRKLQALFPAWFEVGNPVDFWPAAMRGGYRETCVAILEILQADDNVDAILFVIASYKVTGFTVIGPVLSAVADTAARQRDKPVAFWIFGANQDEAIRELESTAVVAGFTSPDRAARALGGLHRYISGVRGLAPALPGVPAGTIKRDVAAILDSSRANGVRVLGAETLEILGDYGVPTAPIRLASDEASAVAQAGELGYPVVMKIASLDIIHKSDVGGVRLNIKDAAQLREAYRGMMVQMGETQPRARIQGVHLQRYLSGGTEVIIGARRDAEFGPVLLFGLGGVYTEVLKDVAFRLAPLSEPEARDMIREVRAVRILEGARGVPAADLDALVQCLVQVSQLMVDFPEIIELDINPLTAGPAGATALDARAVLADRVSSRGLVTP